MFFVIRYSLSSQSLIGQDLDAPILASTLGRPVGSHLRVGLNVLTNGLILFKQPYATEF
jgi:hypothetical protein